MDLILYEGKKSGGFIPLARYRSCTVERDVLCNYATCYITACDPLPVWCRNSTPVFKMVVNLNYRRKENKIPTRYPYLFNPLLCPFKSPGIGSLVGRRLVALSSLTVLSSEYP
jgi:hypothetical protein